MRLAILIAIGILLATPSWAAAALYFEFQPDFSQSLLLASNQTTAEFFLPLNEHMSGMDFWLSNNQAGGTITFTLQNSSGTTVAQRTATVPSIADTAGARFHFNWPTQVAVAGGSPYSVRISTASPTMRMWYGQTNRIVPHNAPPAGSYSSGAMEIDGEQRSDSFLFALYENTETTPPQISNVQVVQSAIGQATIMFNASEPVDARVQYGAEVVQYTGQYSSCIEGVAQCGVALAVAAGTNYDYTLTIRDVWGNETSVTGQFTSLGTAPSGTPTPTAGPSATPTPTATPTPPPDTAAPTITNLRAVNITATGAAVAWTTSEAANSLVIVQSLPFLINAGGGSDSTFELEHLISIGGLESDTLFQARVTSSDGAGNSKVATISFQTLSALATPGPTSSATPTPSATPSPTPTPTVSIGPSDGSGGPIAHWSAPQGGAPSDGYRIDIIGSDGKLIRTIRTRDLSTPLGDIPEGATIVIYADNEGVYEKVGAPATVRHTSFFEQLLAALPYILGGILIVAAAVVGVLKLRRRRNPTPPPPPPAGGSLKDQAAALGKTTI